MPQKDTMKPLENDAVRAAKRSARELKRVIERSGATICYSHCLAVIAQVNGYKNWHVFRALSDGVVIRPVIDLSEEGVESGDEASSDR